MHYACNHTGSRRLRAIRENAGKVFVSCFTAPALISPRVLLAPFSIFGEGFPIAPRSKKMRGRLERNDFYMLLYIYILYRRLTSEFATLDIIHSIHFMCSRSYIGGVVVAWSSRKSSVLCAVCVCMCVRFWFGRVASKVLPFQTKDTTYYSIRSLKGNTV